MYKRLVSVFVAVCVAFSLLTVKIISLNYSSYAKAGNSTATKTLKIGSSRGNIYDIRMNKLVNAEEKTICVAKPSAEAISSVRKSLSSVSSAAVIKTLTEGYPAMFESDKDINTDDVQSFHVPVRYSSSQLANHVIGYIDGDGNGVSGIEKAYNELLTQASGELSVTFSVDANGRTLSGMSPTVNDNNFASKQGVVLTIDKDVQQVAENAMKKIKSGACAIIDCATGAITAAVSRPDYDRNDLAGAIKSDDSPLLNKAFSAYSVGSVFKPILAACAIENKTDITFEHECTGKINVDGTSYGCINKAAHGEVDFENALQVSCNTYFISLTQKMKPGIIHEFCSNLGFGTGAQLADGLYSQDGFLPDESELKNSGNLANFSFGQGDLTATPIQLAGAYAAIANGGKYKYPYIVAGTVSADGTFTEAERKPDSNVLSKETSDKMKKLLESVVTEGNAYYGEASLCTVAGKTGTAQSGIRKANGDEVLRTWFVGFFPVSDPLYAVAVLCEDGISGGKDCGPVFSEIADGVMQVMIDRAN
ncbi:MAG: penicillin-binding protein 2 [Oscillospiraceae bacterium]|nr:penicillin-binding protein 2 [Oscillospiraceae bacterium]